MSDTIDLPFSPADVVAKAKASAGTVNECSFPEPVPPSQQITVPVSVFLELASVNGRANLAMHLVLGELQSEERPTYLLRKELAWRDRMIGVLRRALGMEPLAPSVSPPTEVTAPADPDPDVAF